MSALLVLAILVLVVGVAGAAAFAVALARKGQQRYAEQGDVMPNSARGTMAAEAAQAPPEWSGSHSPEARLHRRLVQAVKALQAQGDMVEEGVQHLELRVELEQHALAVDHRLITVAALPPGAREQALAQVEVSVSAVETATVDLATRIGQTEASSQVMGLEDLSARIKGMTAEG